jgi:2-polyprenyl-3-methyl-5-hydroxy-6-metoxy-1,4-benzoquinol methylase
MRGRFDENGARAVLDAACGTGVHAIAFARRGLRIAGADLSPAMIERARENARAAAVHVDFKVAAFGELAGMFAEPFDAITGCRKEIALGVRRFRCPL